MKWHKILMGCGVVLWTIGIAAPVFAQECHPPVENIRFDGNADGKISLRIIELYEADQEIRQDTTNADGEQMALADRARREEVLQYLQMGVVIGAGDLFKVGIIFQHGDCSAHYQLAAELGKRAQDIGHPSGGWLYAVGTDRYLLSIGQPQYYGTQYVMGGDYRIYSCPIHPAVSDEERKALGVPTLQEAFARTDELNELYALNQAPPLLLRIPTIGNWFNTLIVWSNCFRF